MLSKILRRCLIAAALTCVQGLALGGDSVIDRIRACATEADDAKRLACYDLQIGRSKAGQDEDLGLTGELLRRKQRQAGIAPSAPQDLSGKVVAITQPRFGKFVVTLDNGQVWQQQELLDFSLIVGDVATIRQGLLGAFWLVKADGRTQTRVQRIK